MKLELKHLAPYLPHGLNIQTRRDIFKMIALDSSLCELSIMEVDGKIRKPILLPLSDLTKEIEINGEKFVPIIELTKINNSWIKEDGLEDIIYFETFEGGVCESFIKTASPEDDRILFIELYDLFTQPYNIITKLCEWHFDIFGLIQEGLVININEL